MATLKPDDVCEVCQETRENHGDKHHKFGTLEPIQPGEPARQIPPTAAGKELSNDPVARLQLRMIEQLAKKGVFTGDDLMVIFGGTNGGH